jgi:hypothetical protein
MKLILFVLALISLSAFADSWIIGQGNATYEVKHLVKKVHSESKDLKGKMNCSQTECEFLVAVPVKSFTSSDSNRDLNMLETTEASKFPVTMAKGKVPAEKLKTKGKWTLPIEVDFHGIKKDYNAEIEQTNNMSFKSEFILKLDQHKIERPSLFGIKIEDDVPMTFSLDWKQ